jgi:hypothetical protein
MHDRIGLLALFQDRSVVAVALASVDAYYACIEIMDVAKWRKLTQQNHSRSVGSEPADIAC